MPTSSEELRRLLLTAGDAAKREVRGGIEAAVLVPLYTSGNELIVVFTKRRQDLRMHAGEISFPGGRPDSGDKDLQSTALREAEEEIGLPRESVELVGALPPTATFVTNYAVYPYVGLIEEGFTFKPNPEEVEAVLELSLAELAAGHEKRRLVKKGVPVRTDTYSAGGNLIWGATARMLAHLLERLGPDPS